MEMGILDSDAKKTFATIDIILEYMIERLSEVSGNIRQITNYSLYVHQSSKLICPNLYDLFHFLGFRVAPILRSYDDSPAIE